MTTRSCATKFKVILSCRRLFNFHRDMVGILWIREVAFQAWSVSFGISVFVYSRSLQSLPRFCFIFLFFLGNFALDPFTGSLTTYLDCRVWKEHYNYWISFHAYVKGDETAKRSRKSRFWKTNCFQCQKIVTLFKQTDEKTAIQAEIRLYRLVFFYKWVPLPTCIVLVLNLCFQFVCLKSERPKTFSGTLVSPHGFCFWELISSICIRESKAYISYSEEAKPVENWMSRTL